MMISTILLSASLALADSEATQERAKVLYANGKKLYDDGHYKEAIAAWERCYELSKNDMMLFNLAFAYEKNGELERAISTLRKYQAFVQTDEQRAEVIKKIEEFETKLVAVNATLAAENKAQKEAKLAKAQQEAEKKAKKDEEAKRKRKAELKKKNDAKNKDRIIQYSLYGGAMVALGVGVGYGFRARGARKDLESACQPMGDEWICQLSDMENVESFSQYNTSADLGLSFGAIGLGLALWNTFKPLPPPDIESMTPTLPSSALGVK